FYTRHVIDHPMSVVAGGVRDGVATDEIWTKFTAEEIITCLGLYRRTGDELWLQRALQSGRCLIQARRHGCAPRFSLSSGRWLVAGARVRFLGSGGRRASAAVDSYSR